MIAPQVPSPWIGPAVVAAAIAALVSIMTVIANGILQRRDRQRQLMAEAFEKVQAYREFIYIVRRRMPDSADNAVEDRARINNDLSQVQARLNALSALLKVESPRVGAVYAELVGHTRRIAGGYIRAAWSCAATAEAGPMHITDVDLSALGELDAAYLAVVRAELALRPRTWFLRRRAKSLLRQAKARMAVTPAPGRPPPVE